HIYDQSKLSKIRLLAEALQSIQLYSEGAVAVITIPYDKLLHTQALETDTDGFVNYCMSVEGVKIGMLFLELLEGFKVSFRSKGLIPVNQLAAEFGGGGHRNASGLRIRDAKMQEYYDEIINRAEAYLNREEIV
ncbi:partial Bifunctional oligoribonuclease and PAP phosphatase NrnA, partial [Candidatus Brocadiaceae bacterium]